MFSADSELQLGLLLEKAVEWVMVPPLIDLTIDLEVKFEPPPGTSIDPTDIQFDVCALIASNAVHSMFVVLPVLGVF